jgi:hypothetical protein
MAAHNRAPACQRIKDARRRQACLRRARAHNRRHKGQPKPPICVPQPLAETCAGRCGTRLNNCNQPVACFLCPTGHDCLTNGSCARSCNFSVDCPSGCGCSQATVEGGRHCVESLQTCDDLAQVCTSTAECPPGHHCQETGCSGPNQKRCVRVCPN